MPRTWAEEQYELNRQREEWAYAQEQSDQDSRIDGLLGSIWQVVTDIKGHPNWERPDWYIRKYKQLSTNQLENLYANVNAAWRKAKFPNAPPHSSITMLGVP